MRALKGNDTSISHTTYAADDETATAATGNVVVTVEREDGTALAGGNATGSNPYAFNLTAASHTDELDELTVTWTGTVSSRVVSHTDYVKVVGARYFRLKTLRGMSGLPNTTQNADLVWARDIAEDFVEEFTEHAWVPTYQRDIEDGDNCRELTLSRTSVRRLINVTVDGVAQSTTNWSVTNWGRVITDGDLFIVKIPQGNNISVAYEWGEKAPPGDLMRATLMLARHILLTAQGSPIPDRARLMQTDWGMFHLDTASEDKPTGMPEIDAVLRRYRREQPGWVV